MIPHHHHAHDPLPCFAAAHCGHDCRDSHGHDCTGDGCVSRIEALDSRSGEDEQHKSQLPAAAVLADAVPGMCQSVPVSVQTDACPMYVPDMPPGCTAGIICLCAPPRAPSAV